MLFWPSRFLHNSVSRNVYSLQWRHNERDGVSNHQSYDCLRNRLFKAQIKENFKAPRHCEGNSLVTGEFPAQRASNAEKVSTVWWRHHVVFSYHLLQFNHKRTSNRHVKKIRCHDIELLAWLSGILCHPSQREISLKWMYFCADLASYTNVKFKSKLHSRCVFDETLIHIFNYEKFGLQ